MRGPPDANLKLHDVACDVEDGEALLGSSVLPSPLASGGRVRTNLKAPAGKATCDVASRELFKGALPRGFCRVQVIKALLNWTFTRTRNAPPELRRRYQMEFSGKANHIFFSRFFQETA